jgi:uncharacterized protein YaaN involved in tellurite resistance
MPVNIIKKNNEKTLKTYSDLSPAKQTKVKNLYETLNSDNSNTVIDFGVTVQNKLGANSDVFLTNVRLDKSDEVGQAINTLLSEINELDVNGVSTGKFSNFLSKIPLLNKFTNNVKKFIKKYDTVAVNIDDIVKTLDQARLNIIKDNTKLASLFDSSLESIEELELLIIAAQTKIDDTNAEIQKMVESSANQIEIDTKKDFIYRLEKRLHDMMLTRTITIQTLPQIRIVQGNNITLAEKVRSSINTTIPVWKTQIAMSLALIDQKKISDLDNKMRETTALILTKNAAQLKLNSIQITQQNEQSIVDMETINKVQNDLIETLSEIKKIKEIGTQNRQNALAELNEIKKVLS